MGSSAFKLRADAISSPPKVLFSPTLEGFVYLFTDRSVLNNARIKRMQANIDELNWYERIALSGGQQITGPSTYVQRLRNSVIAEVLLIALVYGVGGLIGLALYALTHIL